MKERRNKLQLGIHKVLIIAGDYFYHSLFDELGVVALEVQTMKELREAMPELKAVLFTGGADVDPELYGGIHKDISMIQPNRDRLESAIFELALKHSVKITGICRGFQFINVMCGGRMYQHITNHAGPLHDVTYPATGDQTMVTSTHHQLVMLPKDAIPVAWSSSNRSTIYIGPEAESIDGPEHEMESAIFPQYNAFGVQFHPELLREGATGRNYYLNVMTDFLNLSIEEFISIYGYKGGDHGEERRGKDKDNQLARGRDN
jgi:gamma-glutamyl-gamma-aminobutyrate hydrolase PuuD